MHIEIAKHLTGLTDMDAQALMCNNEPPDKHAPIFSQQKIPAVSIPFPRVHYLGPKSCVLKSPSVFSDLPIYLSVYCCQKTCFFPTV